MYETFLSFGELFKTLGSSFEMSFTMAVKLVNKFNFVESRRPKTEVIPHYDLQAQLKQGKSR